MIRDVHDRAGLEALARETRAASDDLVGFLAEAVEIQWDPAPIPKPREDTSERAQGEISNPTLDVTLDPRRLALRDAVKEAAEALSKAAITARVARLRLEQALDSWAGHDPDGMDR